MNARYKKLRDGSWGVSVLTSNPPEGQITVKKKDGTTKTETIREILGHSTRDGAKVFVCSITRGSSSGSRRGRTSASFVPCGYPDCNPVHCDECDGLGRYG